MKYKKAGGLRKAVLDYQIPPLFEREIANEQESFALGQIIVCIQSRFPLVTEGKCYVVARQHPNPTMFTCIFKDIDNNIGAMCTSRFRPASFSDLGPLSSEVLSELLKQQRMVFG